MSERKNSSIFSCEICANVVGANKKRHLTFCVVVTFFALVGSCAKGHRATRQFMPRRSRLTCRKPCRSTAEAAALRCRPVVSNVGANLKEHELKEMASSSGTAATYRKRRCSKFGDLLGLVLFILLLAGKNSAFALPVAMDGFLGYESWTIASGNANSVKPGDPSGLSLGVLARTHFWRGQKLFFLVDGGFRSFHATADRKAGDIRVRSELDSVFLGAGGGLGVEVNRKLVFEGLVNFDYSLYSRFQYNASVEGYIPIRGDASLSRLHRVGMALRAFYRIVPDGLIGVEFSPYTGSYVWGNPGTNESQSDSFSGVALRLTYRHFFVDKRPKVKRLRKGRQVEDGMWIKRDSTAKPSEAKPSGAKPSRVRPPRPRAPGAQPSRPQVPQSTKPKPPQRVAPENRLPKTQP